MEATNINTLAASLKNEVVWLNLKWKIYRDTFENPKRSLLLTEAAPIIFAILQKLLLDDIVITLCRLTDPAESGQGRGRKLNNSLFRLLQEKGGDNTILLKLQKKIKPIRKLRDKNIAHSDFDNTLANFCNNTSNGVTAFTLNCPVTVEELEGFIYEINEIMNTANNTKYLYNQIKTPIGQDGGLGILIGHLKAALFYKKLEKSGKINLSSFHEELEQYEHKDA